MRFFSFFCKSSDRLQWIKDIVGAIYVALSPITAGLTAAVALGAPWWYMVASITTLIFFQRLLSRLDFWQHKLMFKEQSKKERKCEEKTIQHSMKSID